MSAIAITGLGLITALGASVAANADAFTRGRSALARARRFDCSAYRSAVVAEVPAGPDRARKAWLGGAAWQEASAAAGLRGLPEGSLLLLAGQAPAPLAPPDLDDRLEPDVHEFVTVPPAGLDLAGVEVCFVSHACASVGFGIALARDWLAAGLAPAAVVVAAAALNRVEYANMDAVRTLSPTGARPFTPDRDGTSLGEGATAIVLERRDLAAARGASALAVVAGAGHLVDARGGPAQSSPDAIRDVVARALDEAGGQAVGYVHAHATGTPQGDAAELDALEVIAEERGWHDLRVGSSKGALGHLLHAAAAPGLVAATLLFRRGIAAGTPNASAVERREHIHVLERPASGRPPAPVLVNSFGFGGSYASLVLTPP